MPSNGRRRHTKIVAPTPSRAQEISGGIKNALDRGEPLEKAKQSFTNAGYTPQEVQEAAQKVASKPSQIAKPLSASQSPVAPAKKTLSKKMIIILSVVGAVVLISALVLGLFWNKLF